MAQRAPQSAGVCRKDLMSDIDPKALRNAFGSFPTGVTVVTALDGEGQPVGFTANSFASVSLDPPLLLVCPGKFLSTFDVFSTCTAFAVNVLSEGQEEVSNTFAFFDGDRFAQVDWKPDARGVPLIEGAAAQFSCRTHQVIPAGDHVILMGAIDMMTHADTRGLGYVSGGYFSLGLERAAASAVREGRALVVGAIVEQGDAILLEDTPEGLRPPQIKVSSHQQARVAMREHLQTMGITARIETAYSIFDSASDAAQFTYFRASAGEADIPTHGSFVPLSELESRSFVAPAMRTMLLRYAAEHQARDYGLYVGDAENGTVHSA